VTTENADDSGTETQTTAYVYGTATNDSTPELFDNDEV
jgi:hypothetical protein